MRIAIVTFDGFNELDSFVAAALLNRVPGWRALIAAPAQMVASMNGVKVVAQLPIDEVEGCDAVLIGSGIRTREVAVDRALLSRLRLNPQRQMIGAQCSGTLLLAKMGLIGNLPACTDSSSKPWVVEAGVRVVEAPFHATGNVATAGGCMAAHYLAAWTIARGAGEAAARHVIDYVAPVGEKAETVARIMGVVGPFLHRDTGSENRICAA